MRKFSFAVAVVAGLYGSSASAQVFSGIDNNNVSGGLTQTGANAPNSIAARNNFLSNLSSSVQTETFEGFSVGTLNPGLSFVGSGPTINATLTGNGRVERVCLSGSCPINYGLADSDPRFFYLSTGSGGGTEFTIKFNQTVAAFGFDGSDIADSGSDFLIQFLLGGTALTGFGTPSLVAANPLRSSNQLFYGYINTGGFDEVRFFSTSGGDFFGFDNMTVGDVKQVVPVPEPASLALVVAGLAGLVGVARRRRAA